MNQQHIAISIELANQTTDKLNLVLSESSSKYSIAIETNDIVGEYSVDGEDYFDCFCGIRQFLGRSNVKPLCAGARVDAYPSGMSRETSGGRQVYITEINQPAGEPLDIFEAAPADKIGTVEEQQKYHERWAKSLA